MFKWWWVNLSNGGACFVEHGQAIALVLSGAEPACLIGDAKVAVARK
jgi:hypothetical protein